MREVIDYNKYESYIRIGHKATEIDDHVYKCTDLEDFPTPSALGTILSDLDKDPYTDLDGYTHRNRVRNDVINTLEISYEILSDNDISYILNRVSPEWFYVELLDKKTKKKSLHKMYCVDKNFNVFRAWKDENNNWHEINSTLTLQFTEE